MAAVGSNTDDSAPDAATVAAPARPPSRLLRVIGWATAAICAGAPVTLALGFAYFVWRLPADEIPLTRVPDGIVVLTGGASLIGEPTDLSATQPRQRRLIAR